jgi:hypothetical protein
MHQKRRFRLQRVADIVWRKKLKVESSDKSVRRIPTNLLAAGVEIAKRQFNSSHELLQFGWLPSDPMQKILEIGRRGVFVV